MFEYFYHEILRKTIIGFGTLFNNITVKHFDESGNISSVIKVPFTLWSYTKVLGKGWAATGFKFSGTNNSTKNVIWI